MNEELKAVRIARSMSQKALAELSGIPQQTIYAYESRKREPSVTAALRLCRVLDCSVEDIFAGLLK